MLVRLTLVTITAIVGGMVLFGTGDNSAPVEEIAETVLSTDREPAPQPDMPAETAATDAPAQAEVENLADATPDDAADPSPEVEVAKQGGLDVTGVMPASMQVDVVVARALKELKPAPRPAATPAAEPEPEPRIVYVTGSRVNLRAGPSTDTTVVDSLVRGTEAMVLAEAADGWLQIRDTATGTEGYMSGDFLSPVNPG